MKEVVLDTNIFIRYFTQDIKSQYKKAKQIFEDIEAENIRGLVSILVVNEIIWIMDKYYEINQSVYLPKLIKLLLLKYIKIIEIDKDRLIRILQTMEKARLDFTDLYLLYTAGETKIFSFDKDLKKNIN